MIRSIIIISLLLSLITPAGSQAGLIVNEVLANEPGSSTTLEWIELYNNSETPIFTQWYRLRIGSTWITLPTLDPALSPGEYFIVCRRLLASGTTPGFESYWGDSSGFWGDTDAEAAMRTPYDISILRLSNAAGTVELLDLADDVISELSWSESGQDGHSWERLSPTGVTIRQSVDIEGSTPGFVNSLTAVNNDLALDDVEVLARDGTTFLIFSLTNRGQTVQANSSVSIVQLLENGFEVPLATVNIPALDPGYSLYWPQEFHFDGLYLDLKATLADDDRLRNNTRSFTAVGSEYPPVILSEVLANPTDGLTSEWVEIYNRHTEAVDIAAWKIGDELGASTISDTALVLYPGEYLLLVDDSLAFGNFYGFTGSGVVAPSSWRAFNNDGDTVKLIDHLEIEADRFGYARTNDSNRTWSRINDPLLGTIWGISVEVGGTPGDLNEVMVEPNSSGLEVTITPDHFSPDGNGIDEVMAITIFAPAASGYQVKIYDRQGRKVKTLVDGEPWLRPVYYWDGRSDGGRRLPIGIYILYVEAAGVESVKKPIVIVR